MIRTIIQLSEDQARHLKTRAKEQGISVSELVRRGVDIVLRSGVTDDELRERAKRAVGFIVDKPDLSTNHDNYLTNAYSDEYSK